MSKEEQFWGWFKINNSKYFFLNQVIDLESKEKLLSEFLDQLHAYCDKLFFEIGGIPNEPQELIISAEGDKAYFDKVERLVSKAPKINDWQIIAFKPPMGFDFITEYEGVKLEVNGIWFLPLESENEPKALGVKLFFSNYSSKKEGSFIGGSYQILDAILGEKSAALEINHIEVGKLPKNPEKEGLIELLELPKYINWRNARV
jgi:hypothetical protein